MFHDLRFKFAANHLTQSKDARSAFSFLELIIVILIIGITAAIATPRFARTLQQATLRSNVRMIQTHLNHARRTAISQGRTTNVAFSPVGKTYSSTNVDFPDQAGTQLDVDLSERIADRVQLAVDFDGASVISFDANGIPVSTTTPINRAEVAVKLDGYVESITIAPAIGKTTIQTGTTITFP